MKETFKAKKPKTQLINGTSEKLINDRNIKIAHKRIKQLENTLPLFHTETKYGQFTEYSNIR